MEGDSQKPYKGPRAPRIRVPNSERALFTVDGVHFVGVLQRLSLTGGSAVLSKGPIPHGTMGDIALNTTFGKVSAHIEFLQTGADGVPLAQAFRFLAMEDASAERFTAAAEQMCRRVSATPRQRRRRRFPRQRLRRWGCCCRVFPASGDAFAGRSSAKG